MTQADGLECVFSPRSLAPLLPPPLPRHGGDERLGPGQAAEYAVQLEPGFRLHWSFHVSAGPPGLGDLVAFSVRRCLGVDHHGGLVFDAIEDSLAVMISNHVLPDPAVFRNVNVRL